MTIDKQQVVIDTWYKHALKAKELSNVFEGIMNEIINK